MATSHRLTGAIESSFLTKSDSYRQKVHAFKRQIIRLMLFANATTLMLVVLAYSSVFCFQCSQYLWASMPAAYLTASFWFGRLAFKSLKISLAIEKGTKSSSAKAPAVGNNSVETVVMSGTEVTSSTKTKRSKPSQFRSRQKARKLDKMSRVSEADYEGTVVLSQAEYNAVNPLKTTPSYLDSIHEISSRDGGELSE